MPAKSRTNVSIDAELLSEARHYGINLSAMLEDRLRQAVAGQRQRQWLEENREALACANEYLERHGLWSDGRRQF